MRFSIRSLMILTYIAGFAFLLGAYYYRNLEANPNYATEKLQRIGGGRGLDQYGAPKKSVLDLSGTTVQNEDLRCVRVLSWDRIAIDLSNTKISDAGLVYLHNITASRINLRGACVTTVSGCRLTMKLNNDISCL